MCQIIMLLFGIYTLIRGRFLLTRASEVRGWPARIIGLVLIAPWPLAFLIGMMLGAMILAQGKSVAGRDFQLTAGFLEFGIVVFCLILAIGIAKVYAQPIRKRQDSESDEVPEIPRHYDEHFSSEPEGGSASRSDRQDVTDRPQRSPMQQDDRIQE